MTKMPRFYGIKGVSAMNWYVVKSKVKQIDKYVKLVVMYVIFIERRNDFKQKLWFLNFWS